MPDRATACGLLVAESTKLRLALRPPAALGLKKTVAEQLPFTETVVPQVVPERTKSDALAPPTEMLLTLIGDVIPFDRTMVCDTVLVPNAVLPKVTLAGLAETTPLVPKPDRATL